MILQRLEEFFHGSPQIVERPVVGDPHVSPLQTLSHIRAKIGQVTVQLALQKLNRMGFGPAVDRLRQMARARWNRTRSTNT